MSTFIRRSCVLFVVVLGFPLAGLVAQQKTPTYGQYVKNEEPRLLNPLPVIGGWIDDGHFLLKKKVEGKSRQYSVDVRTGTETLFEEFASFTALADSGIDLTNPEDRSTDRMVCLYKHAGDIFVLDRGKKSFKRLTQTADEEMNPCLSPDGKKVAFTRGKNLFSIDIASQRETQYTADGSDVISNGWASWVYMEEILGRETRYRAFWWSPDSKHIAFMRFDDSGVPLFPLFDANGVHGTTEYQRYPKAGDPNPEVRIGFVKEGDSTKTWAAFNQADDQYFGPPFWTPDGKELLIQWMNRGQDTLKIFAVNPATGSKREVYLEHQPSWVDWNEDIWFLPKGRSFILKSDRDGWAHLYECSLSGGIKKQLTSGEWGIENVLLADETNRRVYFTARKEASTRIDLYVIGLDKGELQRLTFGEYSHSIDLSPHAQYFLTTYSNVKTPARIALLDIKGKHVRNVADSKNVAFSEYDLGRREIFTVAVPGGFRLPVRWTLPAGFDSLRRYPVIISVYGGPGRMSVNDTWNGLSRDWLAQEGVILMSIDHRCAGHFGKNIVAQMHRRLGYWEMQDYGSIARWLRSLPYVDSTRIGITGSSYGGYVASLALTAGAAEFNYGIAGSSVIDWRLYDSHYTERYMDSPSENPAGYDSSSVLSYVENYKGLLKLYHGTMDDNVHLQNSLQFMDALQEKQKHFELMVYPGGRHGWGGEKGRHLLRENNRFWFQQLLQKELPGYMAK
jgi:dipeptidyl-peptidase 4